MGKRRDCKPLMTCPSRWDSESPFTCFLCFSLLCVSSSVERQLAHSTPRALRRCSVVIWTCVYSPEACATILIWNLSDSPKAPRAPVKSLPPTLTIHTTPRCMVTPCCHHRMLEPLSAVPLSVVSVTEAQPWLEAGDPPGAPTSLPTLPLTMWAFCHLTSSREEG